MKKHNCCDAIRVAEYQAGIFSPADTKKFESHLAACPDCLEALRGLNEDLSRYRTAPAPGQTASGREIRIRISATGLTMPRPTPAFPVLPVYAAEAAGKKTGKPCGMKFLFPAGNAVLTQSRGKKALLEVSLKKNQPVEIMGNRRLLARAEQKISVLLEKKGLYEIRLSGSFGSFGSSSSPFRKVLSLRLV